MSQPEPVDADVVPIRRQQTDGDLLSLYSQLVQLTSTGVSDAVEVLKDDREALAQLLKAHRDLTAAMKLADDVIQSALLKHSIAFGGEAMVGAGWVQVHKTADKKRIDNAAVVGICKREFSQPEFLGDPETGESKASSEVAIAVVDAMTELLGVLNMSFNKWRSKQVKEILGVDLKDYVSTEGGRLTIEIS